MRIVLYGGTFDPIHYGHLILARDALEHLEADSVVLLPAAISPHKLTRIPAPPQLRRDMVAAAIQGEPGFVLDDREIHRAGPSYAYDTVVEIRNENAGAEILYLVGHDNVAALSTWHRYAELAQLVRFVVLHRGGQGSGGLERRIDLSSTEIRERIALGRSIRYLVPQPVRVIIEQNQLYRRHFAAT